MGPASSAQREPSMEEILASIRRIIEDSDSARGPVVHDETAPAERPEGSVIEVDAFRAELRGKADRPESAEVRREADVVVHPPVATVPPVPQPTPRRAAPVERPAAEPSLDAGFGKAVRGRPTRAETQPKSVSSGRPRTERRADAPAAADRRGRRRPPRSSRKEPVARSPPRSANCRRRSPQAGGVASTRSPRRCCDRCSRTGWTTTCPHWWNASCARRSSAWPAGLSPRSALTWR